MGKYISGGIHHQVIRAAEIAEIHQEGASRHEMVQDAREFGAVTSADVAVQTDISGRETFESYMNTWMNFADHVRTEQGENKIENVTGEHVSNYLKDKIESGISENYAKNLCAALSKLQVVLDRVAEQRGTGKSYDIRDKVAEIRSQIKSGELETRAPVQSRAYENPERVIEAIKNPDHQLASRIQLEAGLRIDELKKVTAEQLVGNNQILRTDTKGGLRRTVSVRPDTYRQLQERIAQGGGQWGVHPKGAQRSIKAAAQAVGEKSNGTHGLRWNFARNSYEQKQSAGAGSSAAKKMTAVEMGHHRASITEHYLR